MKTPQLSTLWTFLLERFRASLLLAGLFWLFGWQSYQNIPRENAPDVEIPAGVIQTVFPGASPQDVEKLVTEKIEQEIKKLENVNKYTSTSMGSISIVSVEFDTGTNLTKNFQNLREAIDDAEKDLPDGVLDDPDLQEVKLSDTPIMSLALSGDFSLSQLKRFAEQLEEEIESVSNVKEVNITGIPEEKFHIFLEPKKLENFKLSTEDVAQKIQTHHRDIPLGTIFVQGEKIDIRIQGEFKTVQDFLEFPLFAQNGQIVHLKDVATVRREFDEMEVESLFSEGGPAKRSITLDVVKSVEKTNIFNIIESVFEILETQKQENLLPQSLNISVVFDGAKDIQESLDNLVSSGLQTVVIIAIILFFALGFRESLLALFVLPMSMLMGIIFLFYSGETFNFLSLFALVISLGLLVDNAIIMTEGISENIHDKKMKPQAAARQALVDFRWPIIAGTCTTIFAFFPMLFMITGVSGDYISAIPKTITIVLLCSLFISLFILPVFAAKFFERFPPKELKEGQLMKKIKDWYGGFMSTLLATKAFFVSTVLVAIGLFIFSVSLFPLGWLGVEIFPQSDENYFTASLEMPAGTKLSETKKLIPLAEEAILPYFGEQSDATTWLKNVVFSVGQFSSFDPAQQGGANTPEEEVIGITINLLDKNKRQTTSSEISAMIKEDLIKVLPTFVEVKVSELSAGPPTGSSQIELRLTGDNMPHLEKITDELVSAFESIELKDGSKLKNINDDRGERLPQISYTFDRDKLETFGLSPSQISQTLRSSIEGIQILEITEGEDEIDVEMRLNFNEQTLWTDPKSLEILKVIPLKTPQGNFIRLGDVASFEITSELSSLKHRDGKRTVLLGANIDGNATAGQFLPALNKAIASVEKLPGEQIAIGGDNEESNRLVKEMGAAMTLGLFLILVLLVLQFDSFLQSFVIALLIPFSLTAVFIGFWISGTPISFPTMIGIVALAGIIVNDAIVFIDRINQNRKSGLEAIDAYIKAGKERMQPIMITSITTVLGLIPLALSDPIWEGLGFAIIYGMTLATVLTLLLVPCLILSIEALCALPRKIWNLLWN